ncbi:type VII secretion protein EssB/YukC, partial [Bacillus sp. LL01]|uniref:type VII secretion protein EssB/YukC n=1 Tax=Bacillus sp. LL01 TaxID=1665556 RepID=UPI00240EFE98
MKDHLEIGMIAQINDPIERVIEETEDELKLVMKRPKTILNFNMLTRKTTYAKWLFVHKLVRAVEAHSYQRLNVVV